MSGMRRKPGLLGPHVESFRAWLSQQGYTSSTVRNMLKELGQVGRWLEAEGLKVAAIDEGRLTLFRSARRSAGYRRVPGDPGADAAGEVSARSSGGSAVGDTAGRTARAVPVLDGGGTQLGPGYGAAPPEHRTPLSAGAGHRRGTLRTRGPDRRSRSPHSPPAGRPCPRSRCPAASRPPSPW